jgi:hypothetical protein
LAPEPGGGAGEPEGLRRGVVSARGADGGGCCSGDGAGAGAVGLRAEELEEDFGVAGLRWNPMAALTLPATMAADAGCG